MSFQAVNEIVECLYLSIIYISRMILLGGEGLGHTEQYMTVHGRDE